MNVEIIHMYEYFSSVSICCPGLPSNTESTQLAIIDFKSSTHN